MSKVVYRFTFVVLLATFTLLSFYSEVYGGDIHGEIVFALKREAPPPALSPYSRMRYSEPKVEKKADTAKDDGVVAVVWIEGEVLIDSASIAKQKNIIDQRNLTIIPQITPIQVGSTVIFANSDNVHHNLFSFSPTKPFDLGRYGYGESRSITFNDTGIVHLYCDIHTNMNGVIVVVPNEYFTAVASDGKFEIKDVPGGTYQLRFWSKAYGETTRKIEVPEIGQIDVNVSLSGN